MDLFTYEYLLCHFISCRKYKYKNENNLPQSYRKWIYSLMNACSVSQSVLCQVLNVCSQWWCVLKRIFNKEIIFHIKRIGAETSTYGLLVFIGMNTYLLTEVRNLKTFLKGNDISNRFGQLLLIYQKNIKHRIEHDVLIVLMKFAYIRYSWTLQ